MFPKSLDTCWKDAFWKDAAPPPAVRHDDL